MIPPVFHSYGGGQAICSFYNHRTKTEVSLAQYATNAKAIVAIPFSAFSVFPAGRKRRYFYVGRTIPRSKGELSRSTAVIDIQVCNVIYLYLFPPFPRYSRKGCAVKKTYVRFIPHLALLLLALGCEAGHDKSVNGSLFDRNAGPLERTTAVFDSTVHFGGVFTSSSNVLAGTYGRISAFAVFKYVKPTATVVNILNKVRMTFYVGGTWSEGSQE